MIGIENKDSSFFTIESPDVNIKNADFSRDLISLTINEKMSAISQGTLTFYDPDNLYSRILRTGVRLNITWGYRNLEETPDSTIANKINLDEVSGSLIRRGYQGFVSSPSGSGSNGGVITYNCNFTAFGFRGEELSKIYTTGTKKTVIERAFDDLGVSPILRVVDFTLGADAVTADRYVRQEESVFAFLNRMAIEWKAIFHVGFSSSGAVVGIFVDANKIKTIPLAQYILGAAGTSNVIGYKGEISNVISYKWSSSESESGIGDNVTLDIQDGQIIFRRYVADEERVVTYRLDQKKIQNVFQKAGTEGLGSQVRLTQDLLSRNDFKQIEHFFIPVESSTAPQGYGYRLNCEMVGNPLYIPGNKIKVNNGFPERLGGEQSVWFLHSVAHKIDRSGYMMSIEVVDVFNLSPIGLPVR